MVEDERPHGEALTPRCASIEVEVRSDFRREHDGTLGAEIDLGERVEFARVRRVHDSSIGDDRRPNERSGREHGLPDALQDY